MINAIDGYVDVTREFSNVPDGYVVLYNESSMEYNVIYIEYEFCELNTQDKNEVQRHLNFTFYIMNGEF